MPSCAAAAANTIFLAFGGAFLVLFALGVFRAWGGGSDASDAVKKATDFLVAESKIKGKDDWISIERGTGGNGFEVKFLTDKPKTWVCKIDKNGDLQSCQ
jgi:hypothetical protein